MARFEVVGGQHTPWIRPFHRLLQLIPVEARTRLFPPLDRGRRLVAEEVHRGLISDTHKALRESRDPVGALVAEDIVGIFRDPRWTKVKCSGAALSMGSAPLPPWSRKLPESSACLAAQ